MAAIDDTYTLDELRAPQMDHQVVRPLVERLYNPEDMALGVSHSTLSRKLMLTRPLHSLLPYREPGPVPAASLSQLPAPGR